MARTQRGEQPSSDEEVSYVAAGGAQEIVNVGMVWSIAHVGCSSRFHPLEGDGWECWGPGGQGG